MPSSTIACKIVFARGDYSIRNAILHVGNLSDLNCIIPMNRMGLLSVAEINILGQPYTSIKCMTYCFEAENMACVCPGARRRFGTSRGAVLIVNKETHFSVVDTNIGNINWYNMRCVLETYDYSDTVCITTGKDKFDTSTLCFVLIAARTEFDFIPIDVGFTTRSQLNCITFGESYTTLNCQIVTQTKISDRGCLISMATSPDAYTQILCRIPRLIGDPVEYVSIEVVLGKRFIDDIRCVTIVPPDNYNDLHCTTSPVLAGQPRWNRFRSNNGVIARLMNVGSMKIVQAVIQDNEIAIQASNIERISSLWQVEFDNMGQLGPNYVIVVTIEPGHKVVVIDKPKGEFSL